MLKLDDRIESYLQKIVMMHFYEAMDDYAPNAWSFFYETDNGRIDKYSVIDFTYSLGFDRNLTINGKISAIVNSGDVCVGISRIKLKCCLNKKVGKGFRIITKDALMIEADSSGEKLFSEFQDELLKHLKKNDTFQSVERRFSRAFAPGKRSECTEKSSDKGWKNPYIRHKSGSNKTISRIDRNVCVEDVIVKGLQKCIHNDHTLIPVLAHVLLDVSRFGAPSIVEHQFKAAYCEECDSFFMSQLEYEEMREKGRPLCMVISEKAYKSQWDGSNFEWNDESVLKAYGYTVNKQDDLTEEQRHKILSTIVENGIMSNYACIDHLEFCIRMGSRKSNMDDAIMKWKEDIRFLRGNQPAAFAIKVSSIFRKEYC